MLLLDDFLDGMAQVETPRCQLPLGPRLSMLLSSDPSEYVELS